MARWKLCVSTTFEILPLSTCTLCHQKSYTSKGIQPNFEIFASARRCWRWAFGWKVSGAQVFYVSNSKVKTLRIENIWNFATFNIYTLPSKTCIFEGIHRFSKSLPQLEDVQYGHMGGKVQVRRYFTFAMPRWKLCASTTFEIFHFQNVHCASKNPISPKVFNRLSKSLPQLEDVQCGHLDGMFQVRRYFTFVIARWKLYASTTFEIFATFNLYTVPAKILYLRRYSTDFQNLCLSSKMFNVGIWMVCSGFAGILLLQ